MENAAVVGPGHGADVLRSRQGQGEPPNHSDLWVPSQKLPGLPCGRFPNLTCHAVMQSAVATRKQCLDSQDHKRLRRGNN